MGDFLIDFRPRAQRIGFPSGAEFLKFERHVVLESFHTDPFSLAVSSVDLPNLWGPFHSEDLLIALCGRIDLEESQWREAETMPDSGGYATKFIAKSYREKGALALEGFSGNFTILLYDKKQQLFFVVTDLCGALPVFRSLRGLAPVFSSHPDALSLCLGVGQDWDHDSFCEFLLTSIVTPPHTFYSGVNSIQPGTLIKIDLRMTPVTAKSSSYFSLAYQGDESRSESDLAAELAANFVSSMKKRTLPRLGPVAVALSGGLDSRTVLAAIPDKSNAFAFCCFNRENFEFAAASAVARLLDVKLVPLVRPFDYYADNAELGIRIAGGMGTFANNHFLGISPHLRELGAQNFLTGCYCDYLFKGLPLNTTSSRIFRNETLAPYSHEFYFAHYRKHLPAYKSVLDRLDQRFPESLRDSRSPEKVFELEKLRTFPLFQEGDNTQRLIPQRVLYSFLPVADRSILETYCKIPYTYKLNRSLFKKTVEIICGSALCKIPDANTGAPTNASLWQESLSSAWLKLRNKLRRINPGIATEDSWPDWTYYVPHSEKLKTMWQAPCPAADDIFRRIFPPEDIRPAPADYSGSDLFLFVQMLSLKLWLKQRC